jgi:hypothetical protein
MATLKVDAKHIAQAAAHGVAIALAAREDSHTIHGPIHIICGLPKELFDVTLEGKAGGLAVGAIQAQRAE